MSSLNQAFADIAGIKLGQLNTQRVAYEDAKKALLQRTSQVHCQRDRLQVLAKGVEDELPNGSDASLALSNVRSLASQSKYDPSITDTILARHEQQIKDNLNLYSTQFQFADLYSKLVTELINVRSTIGLQDPKESTFEVVGRKEQVEQKAQWESYAFRKVDVDTKKVKAYLERLFGSPEGRKALDVVRKEVKEDQDFPIPRVNSTSLVPMLKRLLLSDVLSDDKRKTIHSFLDNAPQREEIASVLNMRLGAYKSWKWHSPSVIEMRRGLNGRYRFYPDDDLLDTLLVHHLGTVWSVRMSSYLKKIKEEVWSPCGARGTHAHLNRLKSFLQKDSLISPSDSVDGYLNKHHSDEIFLNQLVQSMSEERGRYEERDTNDKESKGTRKGFVATVQNLLHIIQTVVLTNSELGQDTAIIRSDFEWFGPSLSHDVLLEVLSFFGLNDESTMLFRRILEAPLTFSGEREVRHRVRGTMLATPFADFLSETLLFCLDIAVNGAVDKAGNAARFYRLSDDMWILGSPEQCRKAWDTIEEFNAIMGLKINAEKTGSAVVGSAKTAGLPEGKITYGLLRFDDSGRFVINYEEVDKHIVELKVQLDAARCILDMVQVWNQYAVNFFMRNVGESANCYSRAHVDEISAMFAHIERQLFGNGRGGRIGAYIKTAIAARFDLPSSDIPDVFLYMPVEYGGLGLQNPHVKLQLLRDNVYEDPRQEIKDAILADEVVYRQAVRKLHDDEHLISLEEFNRYPFLTSRNLKEAFMKLLTTATPTTPAYSGDITAVLKSFDFYNMDAELQWLCVMYARDLLERFGGVKMVPNGLLPVAFINYARSEGFHWHQ